ncbi:dolichol-phosphate mannosyltransferase [Conyzicola lurida]|uniref:Dolichol-phosphate mannosyltransferase n=1 Tax=Conyzicola lurida TaxID=1172621 RepID=A0A841AKS0_9MICO|nr:dolichol-phosphate mannosyltransferase [Conyzicola lurida]
MDDAADVLVVVPTYNEIESLGPILDRIRAAVPSADILVVDDGSPDGTGRLADERAAEDAAITVLHRTEKDGLGRAYLAGFAIAASRGYAFVVEIDADGSHDPAELPVMIQLARGGGDLVLGSRWVPGGSVRNWPRRRQAISRAGNAYSRIALRSGIHDITSGFRVFRMTALEWLASTTVSSQGYCFQVEMAWRVEQAGLIVVEHPIEFVERTTGTSKMHAGIVGEALVRVTQWGLAERFGRSRA